jgi:putative acetyltransferase
MFIEIKPIEPDQILEAKRVILSVARNNFRWPEPLEEIIQRFDARGELRDVDEFQSSYLDRQGLFLVALDQGQVIGTGAIRRLEGDTAELKRLWLLETYHGQGIGYRLMQTLLSYARREGYKQVRLLTDRRQVRAIHFYQQVGFHPIDCHSADANDVCLQMAISGENE